MWSQSGPRGSASRLPWRAGGSRLSVVILAAEGPWDVCPNSRPRGLSSPRAGHVRGHLASVRSDLDGCELGQRPTAGRRGCSVSGAPGGGSPLVPLPLPAVGGARTARQRRPQGRCAGGAGALISKRSIQQCEGAVRVLRRLMCDTSPPPDARPLERTDLPASSVRSVSGWRSRILGSVRLSYCHSRQADGS